MSTATIGSLHGATVFLMGEASNTGGNICFGLMLVVFVLMFGFAIRTGKAFGYGYKTCSRTGLKYRSNYAIITFESAPIQFGLQILAGGFGILFCFAYFLGLI